ncbi:unnamed protein product, partial [Mycena citricolor]
SPASIYRNLNGLHGLPGFRWLFIICGLITVPIALTSAGGVTSPGQAQDAAGLVSDPPGTGRWRIYAMCLIWIVGGELESIGSNSLMALWMSASVHPKYTIPNINYYPAGATAVAIIALLGTYAPLSARVKENKRYQVNILIAVCMLISSSVLLAYPSTGSIFFAFYLAGVSYAGQASNFGWCNDLARGDDQERSVILAAMNMWSNAFNAWWSIVFFPANDAPRWRRGMVSIIVLCPLIVLLTAYTRWRQISEQRHEQRETVADTEEKT